MYDSTRLTLIQRISREDRDEQSWEEFVDTYKPYIYCIIKNFNLSHELCEDILQDILVILWKNLPKFEYQPNKCKFRTWLGVVCRNAVKTHLASKAGRKRLLETDYEESLHAVNQFTEPEIEEIAEQEWKTFIAEKALSNIRPKVSEKIFVVIEGTLSQRSDEDLAKEIGTTRSSIRVYRQRGKNALMKEIIRLNQQLDV